MITIIIDRNGDDIKSLYMSGHSGYAEQGSDIICASASTLFYTAANALEELCSLKDIAVINEDTGDGEVNAKITLPDLNGEVSEKAQMIMNTVLVGFRTLEMSVNNGKDRYVELIESRN